ncbi:hypothetical protein [Natrinema sp. CGMCC1.2065]|uniref:hypothetical protein n=1 Tax=Natrinema sp. CGMCC1.2065 TaxID=3445767 RepID=UPI003F4A6409
MSMATETDGGERPEQTITVGETAAGEPYTLPVEEVLTWKLFAIWKSNIGSAIAEFLERIVSINY